LSLNSAVSSAIVLVGPCEAFESSTRFGP
jgi:hypothetical protein